MIFVATSLLLISCNSKPTQKETEIRNNVLTVQDYLATEQDPCKDTIKGTDTISILATKLRALFNEQNKSSQNVVEFFNLFPSTFDTLFLLYGYDDEKGGAPLYSCAHNHADYICTTEQIDEIERLKKFISIGAGADRNKHEDTHLSMCLMELIKKNPIVAASILNKYSQKEIFNLWGYVFGGPHPSNYKEDFDTIYNSIKEKNPVQAKVLKKGYEKILREEEPHGK